VLSFLLAVDAAVVVEAEMQIVAKLWLQVAIWQLLFVVFFASAVTWCFCVRFS
jgi:hypothetical protein